MGDSVGKSHEVELLGKKYKLKSPHDEAYLDGLAAYVTAQVTEVQRRGAVSTLDAALLAALNMADEYHRLKREAEERLAEIGEKAQALAAALDERLDTLQGTAPAGGEVVPDEAVPDDPDEVGENEPRQVGGHRR